MIKKITLSLFFLLFSIAMGFSQNVPGYQGKKLFLEYNFNLNILRMISNGTVEPIHDFQLSYVVARRGQIGLTFDLYQAKNEFEDDQFSGKAIGVNYTWYTKKSLAPVGTFWRVEYKRMMNENNPGVKFNAPYFGLGFGTKRVFFDRLLLNVGLDFGMVWSIQNIDETLTDEYETLQSLYLLRTHIGLGVLLF